jgi:hypothetical protein
MSDAPDERAAGPRQDPAGHEGEGRGGGKAGNDTTSDQGDDASAVPPPPILPPPPEAVEPPPPLIPPPPSLPLPAAGPAVEVAPPRAANPIATAAFVVGIVALLTGILFVTAPFGALLAILALVLGGVGITKARRTNGPGIGLSIAGMVTGLLGLIAASVWLALGIVGNSTEDPRPLVEQIQSAAAEFRGGTIRPVDGLSVGQCFTQLLGGPDLRRVRLIDCSQRHRYEVFAVLRIDAGTGVGYPGVKELRRTADSTCKSEPYTAFVGAHFYASPLEVTSIFPSPDTWTEGDREIVCVISDPDPAGLTTGSLRNYAHRPLIPEPSPVIPSPLRVYPVVPSPLPT